MLRFRFPCPRIGRRWVGVLLAAALVAGCDTWLGEDEEPPLEGKRISVLRHAQSLAPDPEIAATPVVLPPPTVNPEWPQAGGYANHAMHHTRSSEVPRVAWASGIGSGASDTERLVAEPVVAADKVFTIDAESLLSAFDARTGDLLWERDLTPEDEDDAYIAGGLAYYRGGLFVTTGFAEVFGVNATTGKVFWRFNAGAPMRAPPTARHGKVFVVTLENRLIALSASTGKVAWVYEALSEEAGLLRSAAPAVDNGIVVAAFLSGELVALRADSGRELWTVGLAQRARAGALSMMSHIRGNPVIDRGRVYAANHGGLTVALDLATGQRIWEQDMGSGDMPWIAGDYLYILTNESEVVCLNRLNGGIHWVRSLPRFEDDEERIDRIVWSGPILASDRLIISGSNGIALTLSPYDGRILGQVELPDRVTIPPVIANGTIYFLADDATLVAYR